MGQQISSIDAFNTLDEQAQNTFDATTVVTDVDRINGTVVGHGEDGFNRIPYTYWEGTGEENEIETSFVLNDFTRRGFVDINDMTIELPPIDTTLGGRSEALGVNSQLQVVGFSNTEFLSAEGQFELNYAPCPFDDTQETCSVNLFEEDVIIGLGAGGQVLYDLNKIVDEFFQVLPSDCITEGDNIETAQECALRVLQLGTRLIPENFSQNRGMIWQLDDSGNITETTQLGLLFTPEEDDNRVYSSLATGINDNGIAVGQSSDFFDFGDSELVATFAAMFVNDEVIHITSKEIDRSLAIQMISNQVSLFSSATDINNNDLVTGYQLKLVNGFLRRKFFVYDANTSELIFPQDFFNGSSSIPLDINNNNLVVGYGEIEATQVSRRTGGFLYDHNTGEFNDLNSLIDCDSPYFITQANSINDDGDIIATALVKAPIRNLRGEVILENNEPVLTDSVVSVVLQRVSESTPQECEVDEDEQEIRPRQGASVFWLLGLAGIALFRRRLK